MYYTTINHTDERSDFGMDKDLLEILGRRTAREGEEELMLAILEDAVACFQKYVREQGGKGKALFRDAENWILSKNSDWLFSFENICEVLGFDPKYLRQGLMRWKEKARRKGFAAHKQSPKPEQFKGLHKN
ncbi:MAG: hypothetical protein HY695_17995 [Deltaproteobacteria bacterium]|nr:hypothetical protein [Deltaproteobacteria bacterium]